MLSRQEIRAIAEETATLVMEKMAMLNDDMIDSRTVAAILGCSERKVQMLAEHLGGVKMGRMWRFSRNNIVLGLKTGAFENIMIGHV